MPEANQAESAAIQRAPIDFSALQEMEPSFATRLYRLIAEAEENGHEDIVHFNAHGFMMIDRERFVTGKETLPTHGSRWSRTI